MFTLLLSLTLLVTTTYADSQDLNFFAAAKKPKVEVIVSNDCPNCVALEMFLQAKGIEYTRLDVDNDPKARKMYYQLGGGGVPLSKIRGRIVRGFDPVEIMSVYKNGW